MAGGRQGSETEASRFQRALHDLEAVPLAQLVVAGNVVGIGVGGQQVRDVQAVALDCVVQGLERGAGVDEDGRPAVLVSEEVGVREPARMHRPLDDHRAVR